MIKFRCFKRHQDGTPIIRDVDIVKFAEAQLADYRPELLEVPGKIDPLHFIEKYLGANIDFQDLYVEEGGRTIAGEKLDLATGYSNFAQIGDYVDDNIPLAIVHYQTEEQYEMAKADLLNAISIKDKQPPIHNPILMTI